jgi:MYXO-CTERM domain-containing protein
MNKIQTTLAAAACCGFLAASASADLMWDEAIDGDLSSDYLNPTQLYTKGVNNHVIFTTIGAAENGGDQDREYFTFDVAVGYQLEAIILSNFETDPITNLGFIGVAAGNVFPTSPEAPNVTELLGYYLPGVDDVGDDILQAMGNGGGSQGFSGPLGAGSYTFWAQETGPSTDNWDLNFVVSEVPAPGALALLGLGGIAARRRRG